MKDIKKLKNRIHLTVYFEMQPQISQPIPSAFYYKTGITNPTFSKGYDVFFEETSNINFNLNMLNSGRKCIDA